MRRAGPILAAAVVILANVVALVGVARNRAGTPEAEVRLTERELPLSPWTDENTGAFLQLEWQRSFPGSKIETPWFDRAKLESLGFDCSYPAEGKDARERYGRMVPRSAYVVLEYDGPAWRRWLEAREAEPEKKDALPENARVSASRLVPIDVGRDPDDLRRLYPDRTRSLIVPAIVAPRWTLLEEHEGARDGKAVLSGRIQSILVSEVHVPKDLGTSLAALRAADAAVPEPVKARDGERRGPPVPQRRHTPPRYEVRLRYGARREPWVAGVSLLPEVPPED
jgi:hypothetical protein